MKANPKSISEKYDAQDDSGSGFPIEPPGGTSRIDSSHSGVLHPNAFGTSHWNMVDHEELWRIPSCMYSSTRVTNGRKLNTQRSYWARPGAADFPDITRSLEARSTSYSKYNRLGLAEPSEKRGFDRPASVLKKVDKIGSKDSVMVSRSITKPCKNLLRTFIFYPYVFCCFLQGFRECSSVLGKIRVCTFLI